MKQTLLGTAILGALLLSGAYWAGHDNDVISEAHAAQEEQNIGGKIVLLRLAVPAGDEVGNILRKDAQLSAGFSVIDRKGIPAAPITETGFAKDQRNTIVTMAAHTNTD